MLHVKAALSAMGRPTAVAWVATTCAFIVVGFWLTSHLHEQTYGFSKLSEERKHLTLHSEQAFYLSYYFDTIRAASPFHAFAALISDEGSEYPNVINVRAGAGSALLCYVAIGISLAASWAT